MPPTSLSLSPSLLFFLPLQDRETGVFIRPCYQLHQHHVALDDVDMAAVCPNYAHGPHLLHEAPLLSEHMRAVFQDAFKCDAPLISVPAHMLWAMRRIAALGGTLETRHVASLAELDSRGVSPGGENEGKEGARRRRRRRSGSSSSSRRRRTRSFRRRRRIEKNLCLFLSLFLVGSSA